MLVTETRQETTNRNILTHSGSIFNHFRHLSVLLCKAERWAHLEFGESSTDGASLYVLTVQDTWGEQPSDLVTSFRDLHEGI